MFAKAYDIAKMYTHPLVVVMRFFDGTTDGGLGAFVLVNDEGWLMTAAHNLGASFAFQQHQKEHLEYTEKVSKINANKQLSDGKRKALAKAIKPNPKWVTDFAILLSGQLIATEQIIIEGEHDLAFIKVNKAAVAKQAVFPKIIDPNMIKHGTSLCKFGFPFVEVKPTFNTTTRQFELPKDLLPVPFFPIEGIYTRNLLVGKTKDQSMEIMYLETSSPGLKGQSGGPICDSDGNIYAIQSKNVTLPLGFTGTVKIDKKNVEENQFLNIGIGVHPKSIVDLLNKHSIKFDLAS